MALNTPFKFSKSAKQALFSIAICCFYPLCLAQSAPNQEEKQPGQSQQWEQGKTIFDKAACSGCHAGGGNSLHPNQPIKGAEFLKKYKTDSDLEKAIRGGFPQSGMPSYGINKINATEMKALICYIRSLTPKGQK